MNKKDLTPQQKTLIKEIRKTWKTGMEFPLIAKKENAEGYWFTDQREGYPLKEDVDILLKLGLIEEYSTSLYGYNGITCYRPT